MKTRSLLLGFLLISLPVFAAESPWSVVAVDADRAEMVLRDVAGINRTVRPGSAEITRFQVGDVVPAADAQRWAS
jgi:hypothetical protein